MPQVGTFLEEGEEGGGGGRIKKKCGKSLGLQRTEVLPNFQAGLKLISILSLFKISYSCEMSFS